jgi:hypothetical protein
MSRRVLVVLVGMALVGMALAGARFETYEDDCGKTMLVGWEPVMRGTAQTFVARMARVLNSDKYAKDPVVRDVLRRSPFEVGLAPNAADPDVRATKSCILINGDLKSAPVPLSQTADLLADDGKDVTKKAAMYYMTVANMVRASLHGLANAHDATRGSSKHVAAYRRLADIAVTDLEVSRKMVSSMQMLNAAQVPLVEAVLKKREKSSEK